MAISAIRFKALDQQTNVAIADFLSAKSSDILNSPNLNLKVPDANTETLFQNVNQVKDLIPKGAVDTAIRTAKDAMGSIRDIGSFSTKDIDSLIGGLLSGNAVAKGLFSKLGSKCSTKGLSSGKIGKPYDQNVDCGGKKRKGKKDGCNSSEYANVINKLTNGAYASTYKDLNGALQNLVALSKYGYDMNLCGVFSALTGDLDKDVLSRASGALLGYLGGTSNVLGVLDLAGSSAGLHTLTENPDGIKNVFYNFKMPPEVAGKDMVDLNTRFIGAIELFDDGWKSSKFDGMVSTSYSDGYNADVDTLYMCARTNRTVDENNLNSVPVNDFDFMSAGYTMNNSNMGPLFA